MQGSETLSSQEGIAHPVLFSPSGLDSLEHSQEISLVLPSSSVMGQRNVSSPIQTLTSVERREQGGWDKLLLGRKSWQDQGFCQSCLPLLFRLSLSRNNVYIVRVHYCQHYFMCAFSCRRCSSFFLRENISILGCYFHDTALCRVLPEIHYLREKISMSFTATEKMHCCFSS